MNAVVKESSVDDREPQSAATRTDISSARSRRERLRMPLMIAGPLLLAIGAGYFYLFGGRYESTDDAYVRAAQASISSNVSGRVVEVAVHDNQQVRQGDLLFRLDAAPHTIALAEAQAQLGKARLEVEQLKATYRQHKADLAAAQDTLSYRTSEAQRQQHLLDKGIASQAQFDAAVHARQSAQQRFNSAQQQIEVALAALGGDPDIPLEQHPYVMAAQAQLDHARLNLSYTRVVAPKDGVVTRVDELQVGDYITAAKPVFALVSNRDVWIEANFKEVQLAHMRPGQRAEISVDALSGRKLHATVASVSPGTGNEFSVLPAENATGNWVKVVQRVPVRLELDDPSIRLQSGLSAQVEVDTRYQRHLFGTAAAATTASR
jgi:membrane fusion protein (multidrug efflux system)